MGKTTRILIALEWSKRDDITHEKSKICVSLLLFLKIFLNIKLDIVVDLIKASFGQRVNYFIQELSIMITRHEVFDKV